MTKPKEKLSPAKEVWTLDNYLDNEFSYDIYEELTDKDGENFELLEPLEFFRLFYLSIEEIEQNKAKPLTVSKLLRDDLCLYGDRKLTDEQSYFFYEKIFDYYSDLRHDDKQIDICCREISRLQDSLNVYVEFEVGKVSKKRDAFQEILEHCDTLPTHKEQIAYLVQRQTTYEQNKGLEFTFAGQKTFGEKCRLEINKREKSMRLEAATKQTTDGIKKHKDLTIDRAILLMKHLAPRLTGCDQNKVADVIAFLIGRDSEAVRQRFSKIKNKFLNQPEAYNDDVKIVCNYLNLIGFTDEVKKLKRDSGVT